MNSTDDFTKLNLQQPMQPDEAPFVADVLHSLQRLRGPVDETEALAMALCVAGASEQKSPDDLAALIRKFWPAAALAVIEDLSQQPCHNPVTARGAAE